MFDLWEVVNEALITLVVALIGLLVWYLRQWLQQKLSADQMQMVNLVVATAVRAAEQYGGDAEEKKRFAIGAAGTWLSARNIHLDLNDLDAAIEAAVFSELNRFEITPPAISLDLSDYRPGANKPEAFE